ncbi:MAG: cytochrome P450 [Acidimicrobiia bacterium]
MSSEISSLDKSLIRELFDLRSATNLHSGGGFHDDPYPTWKELREKAPVHVGTPHELTGYFGPAVFQCLPEPDRPHYTAFSFEACDAAFRDESVFVSSAPETETDRSSASVNSSMLYMNGKQHRRYRTLVQPSFTPAKAKWWMERWIQETVDALVENLLEGDGTADLNVDFCAAIPMLTITGSFGISVDDALTIRKSIQQGVQGNIETFMRILTPILADRRDNPQDDLISVLIEAEITDDDGHKQELSDAEILSFAYLLLAAGSGTTWKQMGITLAALLTHPEWLEAVRTDRALLRPAIEESLRWTPTDPAFGRFVAQDIDFYGVHIPRGAAIHLNLGAANRDEARWENPNEYNPKRKVMPSLAFGSGPHVCLGMHVARAEMFVGINALLDKLPNLRLDPGKEAPRYIGFYERGATEIPVIFG